MKTKSWWMITGALALAAAAAIAPATQQPAQAADEATTLLFRRRCASCHGMDGRGDTTAGKQVGVKDWKDGKTLKALSDDQIRAIIRDGKKAPDGKERMPEGKRLDAAQIDALLGMVRSFQ